MRVLIALLLLPLFPLPAAAQALHTVPFSIEARASESVPPFDVPFLARAAVPAEVIRVTAALMLDGEVKQTPDWWLTTGDDKELLLRFTPIEANKNYVLDLSITRRLSDDEVADKTEEMMAVVERAITEADFGESDFVSLLGAASKNALFAEWNQLVTDVDGQTLYFQGADAGSLEAIREDTALVQGEVTRRGHRDQIRAYQEEAAQRLEALRGDEQLDTVARWMATRRGKVALDRDRQRAVEELVRLPAAIETAISIGTSSLGARSHVVGQPGVDLDDVRDPEVIGPMIDNYNQTYVALDWVRVLVYQAIGEDELEDAGDLAGELDDTADLFEALISEAAGLRQTLTLRAARLDAAAGDFERTVEDHARIDFASTPDFEARAAAYRGADFGIAVAPELDGVYPTVGLNFYFRPVNKNARVTHGTGWGEFFRRFGVTVGATVTSVEKEDERKGLIGNSGLLIGAGYRVLDSMRLSAGALLFKVTDSTPATDDRTDARYYVALSLDWDVKGAIGGLGSKLW